MSAAQAVIESADDDTSTGDGPRDLFPERKAPLFWLDTDVEIAARLFLDDVRLMDGARPDRRVVLAALERIYAVGMQQFPDSTTLKLAYARYLKQWANAEGMAIRVLVRAFDKVSASPPPRAAGAKHVASLPVRSAPCQTIASPCSRCTRRGSSSASPRCWAHPT